MKFICDAMLGTLARRLRLLGYDCAYESAIADDRLLHRSRSEERILLTRDGPLARRKGAYRLVFVESESVDQAVRQLEREGVIRLGEEAPFTRCLECGGELLAVEDKREIYKEVPPYVYWTREEFKRCRLCRRLYWAGTHLPPLQAIVERHSDRT